MRKSIKNTSNEIHNEIESPVKQLFKDLFHHSHTSFTKGSLRSTPRNSRRRQDDAFNNYLNVKNVNLDKTYYFKKVLKSQKFVPSDKNVSPEENNPNYKITEKNLRKTINESKG